MNLVFCNREKKEFGTQKEALLFALACAKRAPAGVDAYWWDCDVSLTESDCSIKFSSKAEWINVNVVVRDGYSSKMSRALALSKSSGDEEAAIKIITIIYIMQRQLKKLQMSCDCFNLSQGVLEYE